MMLRYFDVSTTVAVKTKQDIKEAGWAESKLASLILDTGLAEFG